MLTARTLGKDVLADLARNCTSMSPGAKDGWSKYGMVVDCSEAIEQVRREWPELAVKILV